MDAILYIILDFNIKVLGLGYGR